MHIPLCASAHWQGLLVAPLVRVALALHPGVLFTAFGATACECWAGTEAVPGSKAVIRWPVPASCCPRCSLLGREWLLARLLLLLASSPLPLVRSSPPAAGVFACFSAAALLSPRRSYLYLGGLLSSVLTTFMWCALYIDCWHAVRVLCLLWARVLTSPAAQTPGAWQMRVERACCTPVGRSCCC